MIIKFILLIFIISSHICGRCPDFCAECYCTTNYPDEYCHKCLECIDGYYLYKEHWYSDFECRKLCIEGFAQEDCKVCDVGDNKDKCIECHDNYELSKDRRTCESKFIQCGNKAFEYCVKCSKLSQSTEYKCDECKYHYILDGNDCIYDNNLTKYKSALNIKPRYCIIIIILIIYFLF